MKKIIIVFLLSFTSIAIGQINSKKYFDESKKLFVEKKYDVALTTINNALITDSLNRSYLIHKINILFNASKCNDAMKVLNKVYEINNEKVDDEIMVFFTALYDCLDEKEKATKILKYYIDDKKYQNDEMIINLGQRLMNEEDYENASLYYKKYVLLKPNDIDAIIDLTRILYTFKNSYEAIKEISIGLKNNKNNVRLFTYLASCYHNNKDYNKALEIENQIIELEYKAEHIASRSMLYELLDQKDKAYEDNKIIMSLVNCNLDYSLKAIEYEFKNKLYENVIKNSYKIIECDIKNEKIVLDGLYTSLFFLNDTKKAEFYLDKKIALNPSNFNPYYIKSNILLKNKQFENVLKFLDLSLKTSDIDSSDIVNIHFLKLSYFLLSEKYEEFKNYFNSSGIKSLNNNLNFTFSESSGNDKTEFILDFDKNKGIINSKLIIPTKIIKLLQNEYRLKIELTK
ncbi:tetratricopeptide repeat protein [Flavobacterium ardleyense]|uniref:Tetratricopeptide repeat protein n=1 Tax=Flavobacterium ardleyense TaxID=2038737 RepID=A0ABW5Z4D9_9FLAO